MMKTFITFICIFSVANLLLINCTKTKIEEPLIKPRLLITLKNDSGKSVTGAVVRLYKNASDTGLLQSSDSTGVVIFNDLDTTLYEWLAVKGCSTNRVSQMSLKRPLVPNGILYGYSVMVQTGVLKIINTASEDYNVSDSVVKIIVKKDSPYIAYRKVRSYLVHSEKVSTPGVGKDTLIRVKCGDTTVLRIPY